MDISNVGSLVAAGKLPVKTNDNDTDDKGGAKAGRNVESQGFAMQSAKSSETSRPASPIAKSGEEDNVIQTKAPGAGKGRVDVLA